MPIVFKYFWIGFIAVNIANAAIWWTRGRPFREGDPALEPGYRSLVRGLVLWGNIPWLIMGAGIVTGHVPDILAYFRLRTGGPFVQAFAVSLVGLWAMALDWIFRRGGADMLVRHPGISNPPFTSPGVVKMFAVLAVVSGVATLVVMYVVNPTFQPM